MSNIERYKKKKMSISLLSKGKSFIWLMIKQEDLL